VGSVDYLKQYLSAPKMPKINENTTAGEYVKEVHPNDVLFGRGSGPNDHEGNIRFREMVAQRKAEYMATNHRQTKAKIAKDIVDQVFGSGGRFLKKLEPSEANKLGLLTEEQMHNQDVYEVVGDDTIMEKAKQALRQNRNLSPKPMPKQCDVSNVNAAATMGQMGAETPGGPVFQSPLTTPAQNQYGFQQQELFHHRQPTPILSNAEQQAMYAAAAALQQQGMSTFPTSQVNPISINPVVTGVGVAQASSDQQEHQNHMYSLDPEGYATYTTTLDDPEEERYLYADSGADNQHQNFHRRNFMEMAGATGNSTRRSSLLGGRKTDPLAPTPISDVTASMGKRESLRLDEIFKRPSLTATQSMQMSELMESFKGMSTTEFNSSDDTIGTIDNLMGMSGSGGAGAISMGHLSGISQMSMNMSTDSIFKSSVTGGGSKNSSMSSGGSGSSPGQQDQRKLSSSADGDSKSSNAATTPKRVATTLGAGDASKKAQTATPNSKHSPGDVSFGSSDFWKSEQLHSLLQAPMESSSTNILEHSHQYASGNVGNNFRFPATRLSITSETSVNMDSTLPRHGQHQQLQYPIFDIDQSGGVPTSSHHGPDPRQR
jgi:hypothetical protein